MVEDTIAPPELEPYTPMTEVLESCPLALIEFVNGIYIYKIGTCGSGGITELGFATSMVQHELGCYDNVCVHPIETVLKTGETYSGGDRPASAGLGNGRGPIGTPPGQNKKLKAAATRRFSRMNERLRTEGTGDLAAHRNVKTSSGNNFCFPKAIEYGLTDETIWAKANKEYSVALGGGDGLSPAQKFGGFDDQPQRDLVSASGEIPRLVQVGVNGHNYGGGGGAVFRVLTVDNVLPSLSSLSCLCYVNLTRCSIANWRPCATI